MSLVFAKLSQRFAQIRNAFLKLLLLFLRQKTSEAGHHNMFSIITYNLRTQIKINARTIFGTCRFLLQIRPSFFMPYNLQACE